MVEDDLSPSLSEGAERQSSKSDLPTEDRTTTKKPPPCSLRGSVSEVLTWRRCGGGIAAYARCCKPRSEVCVCPQTDCNLVPFIAGPCRVSVEADGVKKRPVALLLELLEELLDFVLHVLRVLDLRGTRAATRLGARSR